MTQQAVIKMTMLTYHLEMVAIETSRADDTLRIGEAKNNGSLPRANPWAHILQNYNIYIVRYGG